MTISKTADNSPILAGQTASFTISAWNDGPGHGVRRGDHGHASRRARLDRGQRGLLHRGGVLTCQVGTLAATASRSPSPSARRPPSRPAGPPEHWPTVVRLQRARRATTATTRTAPPSRSSAPRSAWSRPPATAADDTELAPRRARQCDLHLRRDQHRHGGPHGPHPRRRQRHPGEHLRRHHGHLPEHHARRRRLDDLHRDAAGGLRAPDQHRHGHGRPGPRARGRGQRHRRRGRPGAGAGGHPDPDPAARPALAEITPPPTSTLDTTETPISAGNGLLLVLLALAGSMLAIGYLIPSSGALPPAERRG